MPYPSPAPQRRFVKPTHPKSRIPDLEHRDFLPAAGREVNWSVHWARHEKHRDVRVFDSQEAMDAFHPEDVDPSPDIPCAETTPEPARAARAPRPAE